MILLIHKFLQPLSFQKTILKSIRVLLYKNITD